MEIFQNIILDRTIVILIMSQSLSYWALCIGANSLVLYAVIGMNAKIGDWSRVEGTPNDPNPNKPFAKTDNHPLFNQEGKLNPSITIVGE